MPGNHENNRWSNRGKEPYQIRATIFPPSLVYKPVKRKTGKITFSRKKNTGRSHKTTILS
jgi:hypothetical protein